MTEKELNKILESATKHLDRAQLLNLRGTLILLTEEIKALNRELDLAAMAVDENKRLQEEIKELKKAYAILSE